MYRMMILKHMVDKIRRMGYADASTVTVLKDPVYANLVKMDLQDQLIAANDGAKKKAIQEILKELD